MRRAVEQDRLDAHHRVSGEHADVHGVLEALIRRGDVLARDPATRDLVLELVDLLGRDLEGLDRELDLRELARATRLLLVGVVVLLDGLADRLAIGHLSLPTFASTLNSRRMRSTMMSRCNSPMPLMTVWPVSAFCSTRNVGSSSASFWIARPSFSWSAFVFGSIATSSTGSANVIDRGRPACRHPTACRRSSCP